MIRDRNEKRSVIFLVFAVIFFLGFISFTLDLPPGLTVYEFVNEEANQTRDVLITNEIAEQIVNETSIKDINKTSLSETPENIALVDIIEANATENVTEANLTIEDNIAETNITDITKANVTINAALNETSLTILEEKPLHRVVIGQPVRWIKKILPNETTTAVDINIEATNITVRKTLDGKESQVISDNIIVGGTLGANSITGAAVLASGDGFFSNLFRGLLSITGLAIVEEHEEETKRITILEEADELEIEYTLPGPSVIEETISSGKKITVYSELNYTDILSYMTIEETLLENVKLYHVTSDGRELVDAVFLDTNDNNLIDYIEWNIPHLSNQTYEAIIEISNAIHLDSNRDPINNIYDEVKTLDNVWSEQINTNEFVRVNFSLKLDNTRDITVYARNNDSYNAYLEFYIYNSSTAFAQSSLINEEGYYRTLLTNLTGLHSEFDIKVVSSIPTFLEFNYIVDPSVPTHTAPILNSTNEANPTTANLTVYNQSTSDADNNAITNIIDWRLNGTSFAVLNMPFDTNRTGQTGSVIRDYSLNVYNGTLGNTTGSAPLWNITGKRGGAYQFDGKDDLINLSSPANLGTSTAALTISTWIKPANLGGGIVNKNNASSASSQYEFFMTGAGLLRMAGYVGGGRYVFNANTAMSANVWHHAAMTYDGETTTAYLDGVSDGTDTIPSGAIQSGTATLLIGVNVGDTFFNGSIRS